MPDILHIAWAVFLIILFFGGSIFVHELGHYLAARRRGLKVERFSIGFGPKLFSFTRDGVEWCVSLFPLGGYVALPQLADLEGVEGKYEEQEKREKLPKITYTDTVVVAIMGVVFNMIFAFALASILWVVGRPTTESQQTTVVGSLLQKIVDSKGIEQPGPAAAAGVLPGDKILAIDGTEPKNWRDVKQLIVTGVGRNPNTTPEVTLLVERDGAKVTLKATPLLTGPEKLRSLGVLPHEELFVGQIFKDSPAQKAGIQKGDQIMSVNGTLIRTYYDYAQLTEKTENTWVSLEVKRGNETKTLRMMPQEVQIDKKGNKQPLLGFSLEPKTLIVHEDPFTQIAAAASLTWRTLTTLVHPDSDIKINHMSGPPGIAWAIYRLSEDIRLLISFIVIINVNLAILNLLPLPVLDGGHIVLATINKFRKRPINPQYIATLQNVFTIMLLGLMIYIMFFADVPRVGREWKEQAEMKKEEKNLVVPDFTKAVTQP